MDIPDITSAVWKGGREPALTERYFFFFGGAAAAVAEHKEHRHTATRTAVKRVAVSRWWRVRWISGVDLQGIGEFLFVSF